MDRSAWASPPRLCWRNGIRPATGSLKIPVVIVRPFHTTWRGCPTLTESSCIFIVGVPIPDTPVRGRSQPNCVAEPNLATANHVAVEPELGDLHVSRGPQRHLAHRKLRATERSISPADARRESP